ncbi:hypothetical protein ACHAWX_000158 [Stephanocyclus meneghinianus]
MSLLGLLFGIKIVKNFYFVHDLVCGHIIFIPLFALAILQIPHHIQTWLLYHNALSTDVVVSNILRYARKSQESGGAAAAPNEDLIEQISELRKIVQKQEQMIESLGSGGMGGRTVSASTLDVWGEMAFGDSSAQAGYDPAPVMQMPTTMARANDFSFTQPDVMPPR